MNQIFLGQPVDAIKNWFTTEFPSWPTYTTLKFKDGTTQTKEINGAATWENIGVKSDEWSEDNTITYCQLGKNVTEISDCAFFYCRALSSITIPSSVSSIGNSTFSDCYSLSSISIPNSVTTIGNRAFDSCFSLSSIFISNSVTSIGDWAFTTCSSLTSITIPSSVISIGNDPFMGIANANCGDFQSLTLVMFAGRTLQQVRAMAGYPWNITDTSIISAELG